MTAKKSVWAYLSKYATEVMLDKGSVSIGVALEAMEEYAASRISELEAENEKNIKWANDAETRAVAADERIVELEAENKRLREALIDAKEDAAALIEQHRWIPVTERLPKKMEGVIVTNEEDEWVCSGYLHLDGNWYNQFESPDWGDVEIIITHWQPLPQPPKEQ